MLYMYLLTAMCILLVVKTTYNLYLEFTRIYALTNAVVIPVLHTGILSVDKYLTNQKGSLCLNIKYNHGRFYHSMIS